MNVTRTLVRRFLILIVTILWPYCDDLVNKWICNNISLVWVGFSQLRHYMGNSKSQTKQRNVTTQSDIAKLSRSFITTLILKTSQLCENMQFIKSHRSHYGHTSKTTLSQKYHYNYTSCLTVLGILWRLAYNMTSRRVFTKYVPFLDCHKKVTTLTLAQFP